MGRLCVLNSVGELQLAVMVWDERAPLIKILTLLRIHTSLHMFRIAEKGWGSNWAATYHIRRKQVWERFAQSEDRLLLQFSHVSFNAVSEYYGWSGCPFLRMQSVNISEWFWEILSVLWCKPGCPAPPHHAGLTLLFSRACLIDPACAVMHIRYTHTLIWHRWLDVKLMQSYWAKRLNETDQVSCFSPSAY